jgi:hypothetical protein
VKRGRGRSAGCSERRSHRWTVEGFDPACQHRKLVKGELRRVEIAAILIGRLAGIAGRVSDRVVCRRDRSPAAGTTDTTYRWSADATASASESVVRIQSSSLWRRTPGTSGQVDRGGFTSFSACRPRRSRFGMGFILSSVIFAVAFDMSIASERNN